MRMNHVERTKVPKDLAQPCPRCGSIKLMRDEVRENQFAPEGLLYISCCSCKLMGPTVPVGHPFDLGNIMSSYIEAVKRWDSDVWREQFKEGFKS